MRGCWQKTTTLTVLAVYLSAVTVASICHVCWHQPHGHCPSSSACCHHDHASEDHAAGHQAWSAARGSWESLAEDCQVCQFLAQKWMPARPAKAATLFVTVWQRPSRNPLPLHAAPLFTWRIRGPPVVA